MGELNVGVVGLGLGRRFAAALAEEPSVGRLVICDPDSGRLASAQAAVPGIAAGYSHLEAMLGEEDLEAVAVVTPDHLHLPHAEACFQAGCHVLLTKPLATNLDDGRAILRRAAGASKVLMVAHERRFRSQFRAIKQMLDSGELGEIIHLRIDTVQDKRDQFARAPWYASAEAGRTALVGSGIHEVDLARWLVGRPIESVFAYSNALGSLAFPREKTTAALFRFAGDAIAQVTVTYEAHWPRAGSIDDQFRLIAEHGVIVGNRVARDGSDGWETLPGDDDPLTAGVRGCVRSFLKAIAEGGPAPVTGEDAFASLAACVAADESAVAGRTAVPAEV